MRSNSRAVRNSSPVMFETLESRQLMSAAAAHVATPTVHLVTTETRAEIVAAAKEIAAAKAAAAKEAAAEAKTAAKAAAAAAKAAAAAAKKEEAAESKVVKAAAPAVTAPITSFHQTVTKSQYLNLVGTWSGTIGFDGQTANPFSINFQFQLEGSASGSFNLGAAIGNQSAQSTMVISNHNNVRALILNNTLWVGFAGVIQPGGNMMFGRFAYNSPTGWMTGSFSLTRN